MPLGSVLPRTRSAEASGDKPATLDPCRLAGTDVRTGELCPPVVETCLVVFLPESISSKYTRESSLTIVENVAFGLLSSVSWATPSTSGGFGFFHQTRSTVAISTRPAAAIHPAFLRDLGRGIAWGEEILPESDSDSTAKAKSDAD